MEHNNSTKQQLFLDEHYRQKRKINFFRIIIIVVFIGLWEVSTRYGWIDAFVYSSPSRIIKCFVDMLKGGNIFRHIGVTLYETLVSFLLVNGLGIVIAIILWHRLSLAQICEPYLVVLNSLPKSALAPLLIVWLGNNMRTIIVAAVSVAVFGTIISIYTGFIGTSAEKIKLIYTLGGTKRDALFKVIIPSTIPLIISTMKVNIGLSLVGVIIGEFLAANEGLGYLIIYGTQVFKLDMVMMSIIVLCVISGLLYKVINILQKKYSNY